MIETLTALFSSAAGGGLFGLIGNVLVAHNATVPAAGAAGADWKTHPALMVLHDALHVLDNFDFNSIKKGGDL